MKNRKRLEKILDYTFKNADILENALIHRSYTNEHKNNKISNNERLEFLGDAVLEIIVSEHLYKTSEKQEGDLSKMRASMVCEQALASWCLDNSLGDFLILGNGEDNSGGRKRPSVLSNALEAIIGAIYLDGGYEAAKKFTIDKIVSSIVENDEFFVDNKTSLQEIIQEQSGLKLLYSLVDESGPDHKKTYTVHITVNDVCIGIGTGSSKKTAQQAAAKKALDLIKSKENKELFWNNIRNGKYVSERS